MQVPPGAGALNAPGDNQSPEKIRAQADEDAAAQLAQQLKRAEVKPFEGKVTANPPDNRPPNERFTERSGQQPESLGVPKPDPGQAGEAGVFGHPAPAYAPIEEVARDVVLTFVIRDNRPELSIPLMGPGAYEVTIRRQT